MDYTCNKNVMGFTWKKTFSYKLRLYFSSMEKGETSHFTKMQREKDTLQQVQRWACTKESVWAEPKMQM